MEEPVDSGSPRPLDSGPEVGLWRDARDEARVSMWEPLIQHKRAWHEPIADYERAWHEPIADYQRAWHEPIAE
jgi:hypothetical protein